MSTPQHMVALNQANTIRLERAALASGSKSPGSPLRAGSGSPRSSTGLCPTVSATAKLEDFLTWGWLLPTSPSAGVLPARRVQCRLQDGGVDRPSAGRDRRGAQAVLFDLGQARDLHEFDVMHRRAA
jgi:hypothetical protein